MEINTLSIYNANNRLCLHQTKYQTMGNYHMGSIKQKTKHLGSTVQHIHILQRKLKKVTQINYCWFFAF